MNLSEAYNSVYYTEEHILEDMFNLFVEYELFDTDEETLEFVEELVNQELCGEFLGELADIMEVDISEYLVEGVIVERAAALRGIINALSKAGRIKAGLKAGTALGKKPESVVRGAAASTSIRSARAARTPAPAQPQAGRGLAAQQLRKSADVSQATRRLPASGVQVGKAKSQKVTGAAADPWTQFVGRRPRQRGLPTEGPSSRISNRVLPGTSAISTKALPPAGQTSAKKPSTMRYDIRATGGGGDARTQRLASQAAPGSGVNPKVSKMTSSADALNRARRALAGAAAAGVAAGAVAPLVKDTEKKSKPESSVNKYNTMDSDGKVRSRLKVGPKIVGTGSVAGDFDVAFKKAKTSGAKEFEFQGKKYNTKLKNEEVDYFNIVMEHLISEGYVDTNEDALAMMSALDESAVAKIITKALPGVIKTGRAQLTKVKLPPKMDPALKFIKDRIKQQYGAASLMGTPEQKYASASRRAAAANKPKPAQNQDTRSWQQRYADNYNKTYNSSGGFNKSPWD